MIRQNLHRLGMALVLAWGSACGSDNEFGGGGGGDADAGVPGCSLFLTLSQTVSLGEEVVVSAQLSSAGFGAQSYQWQVTKDGVDVPFVPLSMPADRISFVPTEAGPHQIFVTGSEDTVSCTSDLATVNVSPTGALTEEFRLRIVPAGNAPLQDRNISVFGGANSALPAIGIELGQTSSGKLVDSNGNGVAGYLRASKLGTQYPAEFEAFADANGEFTISLPSGVFDFHIVPSGDALPSLTLPNLSASQIFTTTTLPEPQRFAGHVLDAAGQPVSGAHVRLITEGSATTASSTSADGRFEVLSYGTVLTGVRVSPPDDQGFPVLASELAGGQVALVDSDIIIRYSDAITVASANVRLQSGAVAALAGGEWRGEYENAGSVEITSVEALSGDIRSSVTADATGRLVGLLPARTTDLVVISADGTEGSIATAVNWAGGPVAISTTARVALPFVVTQDSLAFEGATSLITPLGKLSSSEESHRANSSSDGSFSASLIAGGSYQVEVSGARAKEVVEVVNVGADLQAIEVTLPKTVEVTGRLTIAGASPAGALLSIFCVQCSGDASSRALASTTADSTGRFTLHIADPGIASE